MQIDFAEGEWQIIECKGCERISFREKWVTSEDIDPATGELEKMIELYPERKTNFLEEKHYTVLPKKIRNIYREIIQSFNMNMYLSCSACLRVIIEEICSQSDITKGNIVGKISKLHIQGFLTERHAEILHQHRFLGNKALHEVQLPTREELLLAIQIMEHTIENIYELQDKFEELEWLKERRLRKEKKQKS